MKSENRFKTATDNLVIWKVRPGDENLRDPQGSYGCGGCGLKDTGHVSEANQHAKDCTAL
ncbi:hypothetical protein [Nonomuraea sp. NPDC050643]|uniref:hypothetical protein n=1 Tax=Nonomuraea sp. NPDC050643 TaxID=3155660 RepID=UPI0033F5AD86